MPMIKKSGKSRIGEVTALYTFSSRDVVLSLCTSSATQLIDCMSLYPVWHVLYDSQDGPLTYRRLRQVNQLRRLIYGKGVMTSAT